MKNTLALFSTLLFIAISLNSCKKEEVIEPTPSSKQEFTYSVDGTSQTATSLYVQKGAFQTLSLSLNGENASYRAILYVDSNLAIGTYSADNNSNQANFNLVPDGMSLSYKIVGGELKITAHDMTANRIEGTFSGKCYNSPSAPTDSVMITNGSFKMNY